MGITISHRVRTDIREAARTNSHRLLMGTKCRSCRSRERHNQFTQWNTVLFATVKFTVIFKCLRKNQKVQTNLSWSSLKALLSETSTFAIFATTRFASIAPSTKILDTAMPVIQWPLGTQPSSHETTSGAHISVCLCRCVRGKRILFVAGEDFAREAEFRKAYTDIYGTEFEDAEILQISPVSRLYHNGVEKEYRIQVVEK